MNRLFYFYPHCYIKSTNKEVLVYDTLTKRNVYLKENPMSKNDKESFRMGFVYFSESLDDFVNQCLVNELGYFVDYDEIPPILYGRELEFVTSLNKERKALGFNLQSYTNSLLREVTILLNNSKDSYTDEMYLQIEYPKYNNQRIALDYIFQQLHPFQYLETIILAGEVGMSMLSNVLVRAKEHNIHVIHRIFFDSINYAFEIELLDRFDNYSLELLVDNSIDISQVKRRIRNQICIKAIVKESNDVYFFETIENVVYLPVLSSNHDNKEILSQMLLSEREILSSSKSIKDCLMSDSVNSIIFGHLTIDLDGSIYVFNKKIASVFESDLPSVVNRWASDKNCIWYKTRKKKNTCKECALHGLCPPISIYEEIGFYKNPCTI